MQIPHGIVGWTVFATGLLVIAYRIHGIDAPRAWVEWLERRFTYQINLRFFGGVLLLAAIGLGYLAGLPGGIMGALFALCVALFALIGLGLLLLQNHMRHLTLASAESSDAHLRITSILIVLFGLGLALAPFFIGG